MKKCTAIIGALVSLIPLSQPMVIGTVAALTSASVILFDAKKGYASQTTLLCDLDTFGGNANQLKQLKKQTWRLNIDENNNRVNTYTKVGDYSFNLTHSIVSKEKGNIIAIRTPNFGGIASLIIELDSKRFAYVHHFIDSGKQVFSIHNGICRDW